MPSIHENAKARLEQVKCKVTRKEEGVVRMTSERTLWGMPLVDVVVGRGRHGGETGRVSAREPGRARGVIAVGDEAEGVLAVGGRARGIFALGGLAVGGAAAGRKTVSMSGRGR